MGNRDINQLTINTKEKYLYLVAEAKRRYGYSIFITDGYRTAQDQLNLYAQGRTKPGSIVTYVDGVNTLSSHQYGIAFDVAFNAPAQLYPSDHQYWENLGKIAREIDLEWGWDLRGWDKPHFQNSGDKPMVNKIYSSELFYTDMSKAMGDNNVFRYPEIAEEKILKLGADDRVRELIRLLHVVSGKIDGQPEMLISDCKKGGKCDHGEFECNHGNPLELIGAFGTRALAHQNKTFYYKFVNDHPKREGATEQILFNNAFRQLEWVMNGYKFVRDDNREGQIEIVFTKNGDPLMPKKDDGTYFTFKPRALAFAMSPSSRYAGKMFINTEANIDMSSEAGTNSAVKMFTHEGAHLLGLGHSTNPDSIMYGINDQSKRVNRTTEDLALLNKLYP